jgi:hypothetical protein
MNLFKLTSFLGDRSDVSYVPFYLPRFHHLLGCADLSFTIESKLLKLRFTLFRLSRHYLKSSNRRYLLRRFVLIMKTSTAIIFVKAAASSSLAAQQAVAQAVPAESLPSFEY